MRWQVTSWCEGWKICLQRTESKCQDGARTATYACGSRRMKRTVAPRNMTPDICYSY